MTNSCGIPQEIINSGLYFLTLSLGKKATINLVVGSVLLLYSWDRDKKPQGLATSAVPSQYHSTSVPKLLQG